MTCLARAFKSVVGVLGLPGGRDGRDRGVLAADSCVLNQNARDPGVAAFPAMNWEVLRLTLKHTIEASRGSIHERLSMGMMIITLVENTVHKPGLIAEHGLSFLIATPGGNILFDTGQGFALPPNAERLGTDLRRISSVVLSHGHFDHTGGLSWLLKQTGPKPVFAHPSAFLRKYSARQGELRSIGVPESREALQHAGMELITCTQPVQVAPGVLATGPIPRVTGFEQVPHRFLTDAPDGSGLVQDFLEDDQALILDHREGPVVVVGCGHSGIINTLLHAAALTRKRRFPLVIGGMHLIDADDACLEQTLESLRQFEIANIAPCHCTGPRGQFALWQKFGNAFHFNSTGDRIEFAGQKTHFRSD